MDRGAHVDTAIDVLYEAAAEPNSWSDALTLIADLLGAAGAQFFIWDKSCSAMSFSAVGRLPDEGNAAYVSHYGAIDTRRQALDRLPAQQVLATDETFDGGRFRRSEFFNDFLLPYDVPYAACSRVLVTERQSAVIGVLRHRHQGPFDAPALGKLDHLLPHLGRVACLHHKLADLRQRSQMTTSALDMLAHGFLITDIDGRVHLMNRAALEMVGEGHGLALSHGRLSAARPGDAARLARMIAVAARPKGGSPGQACSAMQVTGPSGCRSLALLVMPLCLAPQFATISANPAAIVMISEPSAAPRLPEQCLMGMFALTAAEARLAITLGSGRRLECIAAERGRSMSTLRTQMRAILNKTGTDRQADLLRLLGTLPPLRDYS
ncbi:MAG: hypothetical protein R3F54_30340 [Alphaproteobacteria bacterium]